MEDHKKVLVTKTGRDREATGEVGGRPVFSGNGRFPAEPSDRPGWERGVDGGRARCEGWCEGWKG